MSTIYSDEKTGTFRILFRFGGKQFHKSLETSDEVKARGMKAAIDEVCHDLKRGRLSLPADADFWAFVKSGGRLAQSPSLPEYITLEKLFTRYEELLPAGHHEDSTKGTYRLHKKHLLRLLGGKRPAQLLTLTDFQDYANRRTRETFQGKPISPVTVRKEVSTFRAVWNFGVSHGLLNGTAPVRGLRFDKGEEAGQFLTWAEIEQRNNPDLWDCLYLDKEQIEEVLDFVQKNARYAFIFPMFVFVAHTGARRSEMLRSRVEDLDFQSGYVTIREKKRNRSVKESTRTVPMSARLRLALKSWLTNGHPGGPYTFTLPDTMMRSRKRSRFTGWQNQYDRATTYKERLSTVQERTEHPGYVPLTKDEAVHHFKKTLAGSKWEVVRGFHTFRHSFVSNLCRAGVDQREIDAIVGHTTEAMRRRYRHVAPPQKENAIKLLFG